MTVNVSNGLTANDTDSDSNLLVIQKIGDPAHGTLQLNLDGSFTYTPNAGFSGIDSFTYKADDGLNLSNIATVTITVNNVNDPPQAVPDLYSTLEDTPLVVNALNGVLSNDIDQNNDPLTAQLVSGTAHGQLTLHADGSFVYTPAPDFNGTDSFVYMAKDPDGLNSTAMATITIIPVNDEPVGVIANSGPLTVFVPGRVQFSSAWSFDVEGALNYLWDFKDGHTSTEANPEHTFMVAGTYEVTLTVTDETSSSSPPVHITVIAIETRGLLVKKGNIEIDWASHTRGKQADRLLLEGQLDFSDIPADLTGVTFNVLVNDHLTGTEIAFARSQLIKITGVDESQLRFRITSRTGRFTLKLTQADLREALNFTNGYAGPESTEVQIRVVVNFPGRASISWSNRLLFDFTGKTDRMIQGSYRFDSETALEPVFTVRYARAKQLDRSSVHKIVFKGFIQPGAAQVWDPSGSASVKVGNSVTIPLALQSITGRDGKIYNFKAKDLDLTIDTNLNRFVLTFAAAEGSGLPLAAPDAAVAHRLKLQLSIPQVEGDPVVFETEIELTRRQSTFSNWR